jgi:hypothetical protein
VPRLRPTIAVCLVASAAFAGCRALSLPSFPPLKPPPTAHEVPAEQLVFYSDFPLERDHRLVRELTAERDDVARTLELPPSNEQIEVHLFRDAEAYGEYLQRHFPTVPSRRAFFVETDTRLAVYAHWSDRVAEDLRHEVAHGYLHASVPPIPLWLDEGLAEYFEVPRGNGGLNRPHLQLLSDMMEHGPWQPNIERLEQFDSAGDMQQIDYAESWAWAYFLLNSPPERREILIKYLADLHDQGASGPLSRRLAKHSIRPEQLLAEYLVTLNTEVAMRESRPK